MIVLDASAALALLLNTDVAPAVADQVFENNASSLHAPHLIDLEIAQVLRRLVRLGEIDNVRALDAFQDLDDLNITRYPHHILIAGIWSLRDNVTAYDAAYLVLAKELGATLLTCDKALKTIPGFRNRVTIIL